MTTLGPAVALERDPAGQVIVTMLSHGVSVDDRSLLQPGDGQPAGSRLGLHVTAEELAVWRDRWANGTGDSFLNARVNEEKTRITSNKNAFMTNPSAHLWGYDLSGWLDSSGYVMQGFENTTQIREARIRAARVRDAAFWALVNHHDPSAPQVLDAVKSTILAQPDQLNVNNFANDKPWGPSGTGLRDAAAPHFAVTHATVTALHTYDYLRVAAQLGIINDLTSTQHAKIKAWHTGWAYTLQVSMDHQAGLPFINRLADDYRLNSSYSDPNNLWTSWRYSPDGPAIHRGHNIWHNRRAANTRQIALTGLMFNDDFLKARAHRWLRDWYRYHLYPHGATADISRGASQANTGTGYMALGASHVLTSVDAFARAGDTSLYDYATTTGMHDTVGAPHHGNTGGKNFLFFTQTMARYGNNTFARYNSNNQRFDLRTPANLGLHDRFIPANIYYQDTGLSRDFYRGTNGQPTWVNPPSTTDLNDAWAFPATYLMWAGLEGHIWPYPTT